MYRLTDAGKAELDRWLAEPFVRQTGYRDDFFLKLFVASRFGPDRLRDVVRVQREAYLAEVSSLADLKRKHRSEPLVALFIEAATLHTIANLRVAELADERAEEISAAQTADIAEAVERAGSEAQTSTGQSGSGDSLSIRKAADGWPVGP